MQAALVDHVNRLSWSRQQIEDYQARRLRTLLAHAGQRSAFHARRLGGLDPTRASVADLAELPVMTKQDTQQQWDAIVTAPGLDRACAERTIAAQQGFSYDGGNQFFSSGGSSGVRGVYVWDWEFYISTACLAWRMQVRDEPAGGPTRLAVLTAGVAPHASTPLFDVPTAPGMQTVVIAAGAPFDDVLAAVANLRPTHLVGYPTVIARLARASLDGHLPIAPVRVSTNSEPLLDEDRRSISEAWHPVIHNLWGSTEIGVQAVGCGYGDGLHVCEDEVILERVEGRTLATGLNNRTFPFIRYDLGDQITPLSGNCPCGSAFARIGEVDGRLDDDFDYRGLVLPPSVFRHTLGTDPRVSEYQVIQTATGADVVVVGSADVAALTAALVAALQRHGLTDPTIRIRLADKLNRHASTGKLRRFIPLA